MRIAFILPSLANKGPIIMAKELVTYLTREGENCDVYYFDDLQGLSFPCFTQRIDFFKSIDFVRYDIIHSHLFRPDLYCAYHYKKIKYSKAKLLTTIHTAIYDDLKYTYGFLISTALIPIWRMAWKKADYVVVLTETAKKYYQRTPFQSVSVINNGRDLQLPFDPIAEADIEKINALKKKYLLLGTVCSIDSRKGLEQILSLLAAHQQYAFVVIGDGKQTEQLKRMAITLGIFERFLIMGFRPDGYRYIPLFNLYVLPSRSEGLPMAMLEAMALKVPLVCAIIPSFAGEFEAHMCTFFQLDDVDSLANACSIALATAGDKVNLAYQLYRSNYMVAQMGRKYLALYQYMSNMS